MLQKSCFIHLQIAYKNKTQLTSNIYYGLKKIMLIDSVDLVYLAAMKGSDALAYYKSYTLIFIYKNQHNLRTKAFFSLKKSKIRTKKGFIFSLRTILLFNEAF